MLHRSTSTTSAWWPGLGGAWQRNLRSGLSSALAGYLLILAIFCTLGCVYLWEANNISQLYSELDQLERRLLTLEVENIRLVQQSAQWNAPSHVEQRMRAEGFVDAESIIYAQIAAPNAQPGAAAPTEIAQSPGTP